MNQDQTCPECGKPLPGSAPGGMCPGCLLKRAGEGDTVGFTAEDQRSARWMPPTPEDLAVAFPELEILGLVGRGGMGAVYKARQKSLDRLVALKILPPDLGQDGNFAERFEGEAQAMARLNHPHIVTIHEFGQRQNAAEARVGAGLYFFMMEFVDGTNLRNLLDAGHITPREALAIVPQICDALQYAHDQGIVHRDIKPENILLNKQGQVKIADFGLAKLMGRAAAEGEKVMGTPQYMAPEQTERPAEVDHRADIYSLGVVFYQMLTGELPVGRFALPSKKVRLDVRLDEVVLKALEREPEKRYQQASEIKTQIDTIAVALGGNRRGDTPDRIRPLSPATPVVPPDRFRRRLVLALIFVPLGMFLVLAIVLAIVYMAWGSARSDARPDVSPAMPAIPSFSDNAASSGISVEVNSKGEMVIEARKWSFVELVSRVFRDLPQVDKTASHNVNITGNSSGIIQKVSCRFTFHNQAEAIEQLEAIGSCVITVSHDGAKEVVTLSRRVESPSGPASAQSGTP